MENFTLDALFESDWPGIRTEKIRGKVVKFAHLPALCVGLGIEYDGQLERWQEKSELKKGLKIIQGIPFVISDMVVNWLNIIPLEEIQPWQHENIEKLKVHHERDLERDKITAHLPGPVQPTLPGPVQPPITAMGSKIPQIFSLRKEGYK